MLNDKSLRTKICLCGINPSVGRKMAKGEFKELYCDLEYEHEVDRYMVSLKVNMDELGEKERKKLKERISDFENNSEWKNVFRITVLNKVKL